MSELKTIEIPDIGDSKDVEVIELLVSVGDTVVEEDSLLTLESDKASMDVPSPFAGVVTSLQVKVGDKVSEGSVIGVMEVAVSSSPAADSATATPPSPAETTQVAPAANNHLGGADLECELLVLGAGPGGYSAAFRGADLGLKTVIVERYSSLGGVCLNVGCIPSKALLHVANVMDEAQHMADLGIKFSKPEIDIDQLRGHKEKVVSKLTGGLKGMAKARKVETVRGIGKFLDAFHIEVSMTDGDAKEETGSKKIIKFQRCIIAAGSQSVKLPFLPDDPRIVDSTGALAMPSVPKRMLVVGGGIIGLEMATVYSSLGARIDVVEMLDGLMQGADRDLVKVWDKINKHRFDHVMLKTKTVSAEAREDGIHVQFEGEKAPADPQVYDLVLQAVGRSPNGGKLCADNAGIAVTERGFINVDQNMRTNVPHIFAIGDIVGQPMLAHKAVHEAHVAAEVAAGDLQNDAKLSASAFDPLQIPSVAYTDPEVAWAGKTEEQCKAAGIEYDKGVFPWAASGRAIANTRDEGFSKLIFDKESGRIIGGGIVGTHAGDLISEVCLAIEMGSDAIDIGKTVHPHPTLGESIGLAAEVAHGSCTDLPPQRKRKG